MVGCIGACGSAFNVFACTNPPLSAPPADIKITDGSDNQIGRQMTDRGQKEFWQAFHQANARLRLLSPLEISVVRGSERIGECRQSKSHKDSIRGVRLLFAAKPCDSARDGIAIFWNAH
jgi:hypothetical protein